MRRMWFSIAAVPPPARETGLTHLVSRMGDAMKAPYSAVRYAVVWRLHRAERGVKKTFRTVYQDAMFGNLGNIEVDRLADEAEKQLGGEDGMRAWLQARMDEEAPARDAEQQRASAANLAWMRAKAERRRNEKALASNEVLASVMEG